ncbi:hypothetical protein CTEN210_16726 [Chaetoceros tenuissimus]|uniref:Uncharacterized protein n=1 Tax=Chaetoceros tenuissimus TaxID=426638 RepID=A0AAD3DC46_9STRA|nr:hypothetical protein CTEN210_16726 [Chaetoceros tenuissimus]
MLRSPRGSHHKVLKFSPLKKFSSPDNDYASISKRLQTPRGGSSTKRPSFEKIVVSKLFLDKKYAIPILVTIILLWNTILKKAQVSIFNNFPQSVYYKSSEAKETKLAIDINPRKKYYTRDYYTHREHDSMNSNSFNDVFYFDDAVMNNIRETYKGARSRIVWDSGLPPQILIDEKINFQSIPLMATVDRRPLIVRKQLKDSEMKDPDLLGCTVTSATFVSDLPFQHLEKDQDFQPTCDVCFQFSNREDMANFVPGHGYEPLNTNDFSLGTKCFKGEANVHTRFAKWQKIDERFPDYGFPWTMECMLPNGIKELTCREISMMQEGIENRDDLKNISFRTSMKLESSIEDKRNQFRVNTEWPWTALMSHDDDRSAIANNLSMAWNDVKSKFVPSNHHEMTLAHVEGPGYDKTQYNGSLSLKSMNTDKQSKGGIHPRLVSNLFHLIRNAPGSTHMMAVVDGQARRSYQEVVKLLNTSISDLFKVYGKRVFGNIGTMELLLEQVLIPIDAMQPSTKLSSASLRSSMTLMELLRIRNIKIHMIPIITPSLVFEKSVCGGQYTFTPYLAARYAADYQVIMFIDGDTAMVEGNNKRTLNEMLYDRFFSKDSSKCAGHRMRLIEQYVKPENNNLEKVLQCTQDLALDKNKWKYAMENCHLKEGHIVARSDSIYAFSVHHPDTLPEYLPEGVEDCITPPQIISDRYYIGEDEFVQLHLRDRERKAECACFINEENTNAELR